MKKQKMICWVFTWRERRAAVVLAGCLDLNGAIVGRDGIDTARPFLWGLKIESAKRDRFTNVPDEFAIQCE